MNLALPAELGLADFVRPPACLLPGSRAGMDADAFITFRFFMAIFCVHVRGFAYVRELIAN